MPSGSIRGEGARGICLDDSYGDALFGGQKIILEEIRLLNLVAHPVQILLAGRPGIGWGLFAGMATGTVFCEDDFAALQLFCVPSEERRSAGRILQARPDHLLQKCSEVGKALRGGLPVDRETWPKAW